MQFGACEWLKGELHGLVDRYLDTISLDPRELAAQLRRAAEEARAGGDWRGMGAIFLMLSPAQRELVRPHAGADVACSRGTPRS